MRTDHIFIYRFSALGDVAMLVPVVGALAKQYPDLRITVMSKPFAKPFFDNLPPNVGFMAADLKNEYKGIKGLNKLYRRVTAKRYTAIADMHDVLRTKYLRFLFLINGNKVAHINKHRKGKKLLLKYYNKTFEQQPTSFENYAAVLEKLGYPIKLEFQSIYGDGKGNLDELPETFRRTDHQEDWIGVAPFAAHQGKIYPLDKMKEALLLIHKQRPNARFFFFCGGQSEHEQVAELCSALPNSVDASALLGGISNELILMSHLDVMLSMDSGNMHLASMVGTRVVSVWGATHPYAGFLGWNQRESDIVEFPIECRPCSIYGNKPCRRGDHACLNNITPATVAKKVVTILEEKK